MSVTARRMTNTGAWVDTVRRVPPERMTDEQLKDKIGGCNSGKGCGDCNILHMCKYGLEWDRRAKK